MADNNYQSNNGHTPFRRYEPPNHAGASPGPLPPLSPPPLTTGNAVPVPPRGTLRRQRNARNRWRQWLQATPTKEAPATRSSGRGTPTRRSPQSASAPAPPPSPYQSTTSLSTGQSAAAPAPSPRLNEPSSRVKNPVGSAAPPARPKGPQTAPPSRPRARNGPPQSPVNNVTPLRRQPVWSTPENESTERGPARRKPRRPARKTPQPILYGIRLLILGTGIAAIAGTVLSSLKPGDESARSTAASRNATETVAASRGRGAAADLTQPLPLAEELVAVETDLVALESMTPGLTQSVFFYDLDTGNYIDLNGREAVAAASTIKVPILVAFLRAVDAGTVRLDQAVTLQEEMIASGSGDMQVQEAGTQYTALEVATEMIVSSDNTATNLMITLLGGNSVLNQEFQEWGLESTALKNLLPDLDGTNTTSAADLVRMMALVDEGKLLSVRSRDRLFSIMQRTYNRTLIPDGLNDDTALSYNKTGDIGTALGDIALVDVINGHRYVVGVLVDRPFNDGRASELIRRVAGRIHEEMNQPVSPVGSGQPSGAATESPLPPTAPAIGDDTTANPESEADDPEIAPETDVDPSGAPYSDPAIPRG